MTLRASSLQVGQAFSATVVDGLTRTQIVQYAGASGDFNPLHTDEVYATRVAGYPSVFAHGMLTMGLTGRLLTDTAGDGRLVRYGVRFVKQVWPGDNLVATMTVTAQRGSEHDQEQEADVEIVTVNQAGEIVLTGNATFRLDP
jgi:acyl dehydratase